MEVNQVLDSLMESVKSVSDLTGEAIKQVPQVAQEMLYFGMYNSIIGLLLASAFLGASIYIYYKAYKAYKEDTDYSFGVIVSAILIISSLCIIGLEVSTIIKIKVAPRLYIMDQIVYKTNQFNKNCK